MAKAYLGIDIGHDTLKLALVQGGQVKKTAFVNMPINLLREGHITSTESFGELLAGAIRKEKMRAQLGAVVLSEESSYLRTTSMPKMTDEQLMINLPYEFSDYITGELTDYLYDYALIPPIGGEAPKEGEEEKLSLLVSAVQVTALDELRDALRKAGVKLAKAAPAECAYIGLIRAHEIKTGVPDAEYCIIDLGNRAVRMFIFRGPRHVATRVLDIGMNSLDQIVADAKGVDVHLAHTYFTTNFEQCQEADYSKSAYDGIAVELLRALNFYRFSNQDSRISRAYLCGGYVGVAPLRESIAATLDIEIHSISELLPNEVPNGDTFALAVGAALY